MKYLMVFVTVPTKKAAKKLSDALLDKRLAACVNIVSNVESHFLWQGKKENSKEYLLIIKTAGGLFKKLVKAVKSVHPYEVPEIIAVPIESGNKDYLDWIGDITR